jgi:hypothetical protein
MKKIICSLFAVAALLLGGCTRIATGEVGLRIDWNNQTSATELVEGSWNQTLVGHVLTFPIREVGIAINDRHPLTAENTPLGDFDVVVTYNITPSTVSELWAKHSRSFHNYHEKQGEWHLMENYITTMIDNAVLKTVRQYKQLEVNDNRQKIEMEIISTLRDELKREHLDTSIAFNNIQVKSMVPHPDILASATAVVRTQNELLVKQNEVNIARKEAERMSALSANSQQSIAYMDAEARKNMGLAMLNGKVNTVVVPFDFKGFVNLK